MIWTFVLTAFIAFFTSVGSYDPDRDLTTLQIIQRHGYSAEAHTVLTEDGYILTLHRITGSPTRRRSPIINSDIFSPNVLPVSEVDAPSFAITKSENPEISSHPNNDSQITSRPVFLQHGLLGSSTDWIFSGPENALAYLLADEGYDVWLGNARGNTHSKAHANLSTSDSKYWDFSWHEMGFYDLPAAIDYILSETGYSSLVYIGFSMGTTMFYVMGTTRPEYNDKVLVMFSLAPAASIGHLKGPLRLAAHFADQIEFFLRLTGADVRLSRSQTFQRFAKNVCLLGYIPKIICRNTIYSIAGGDASQFNMTLLSIILGHAPAGTSLKTLLHYAQEIRSGKFQKYDRGNKQRNIDVYNRTVPPEYDLSLLRVPIELHHAKNDWLSYTTDVEDLYLKLKNKMGKYIVNIPGFGHFDFLWGKSAKAWVYQPVIRRIKLLSPALRDKVVVKRSSAGVEDIFNDAKIKLMAQPDIEKSQNKGAKSRVSKKETSSQEDVTQMPKELQKPEKDASFPDKIKDIWNKFYEKVMALPVKENVEKEKPKIEVQAKGPETKKIEVKKKVPETKKIDLKKKVAEAKKSSSQGKRTN